MRNVVHERRTYVPRYYRKRKLKAALVIMIISAPIILLNQCMDRSSKNEHMAVEPKTAQMNLESNYHQESSYEKSRFRCDGRILCS